MVEAIEGRHHEVASNGHAQPPDIDVHVYKDRERERCIYIYMFMYTYADIDAGRRFQVRGGWDSRAAFLKKELLEAIPCDK